jgi:hypothetical protein
MWDDSVATHSALGKIRGDRNDNRHDDEKGKDFDQPFRSSDTLIQKPDLVPQFMRCHFLRIHGNTPPMKAGDGDTVTYLH